MSWFDAVEFCNELSRRENRTPRYPMDAKTRSEAGLIGAATVFLIDGDGYRLPTEAEWEYSCRAGTTTPFHFGTSSNGRDANLDGDLPFGTTAQGPYLNRTTAVGSYTANAFGLHDMHGNLWEWCFDSPASYEVAARPVDGLRGTGSSFRVCRGGGYAYTAHYARSAYRSRDPDGSASGHIGVRPARRVEFAAGSR